MAEQKRAVPAESKRKAGDAAAETRTDAAKAGAVAKKGKKIKEDIDKLLDEIDDILEENADEFVKSYVQRGGE
ncbi:MAG: ubiquitin-like protein Pup [Candidatus Liptonbacteria bacterium RIFCSPLOWO2_12_FULL_60_15]|uniref:Prokaryotic ubiquitin-like protein Pup n=2 Tax=Candidatus Liptoniibacteriota TaxID=1817909 RepID=A0A1G2CM46_9BACT|nr:MAG: ubiquitin-like protein Pup [Candidatus Liptonbacteria bacterium RIFCSPHIGHO2_12_FULL_60_13]OGZ01830.1 MAG: ubiquitin-like protein Pup [Candidatus Liptonbacteria bacterium RIFCSPLOWO2_12_FULL_60_15]